MTPVRVVCYDVYMVRMLKVKGVSGRKVHIANTKLIGKTETIAVCATRLKGELSETTDEVTCMFCAERKHLLGAA